MAKLKDKIVGYISPKQRKINTLENKISTLEGVIKDELYNLFIEKLGEPAEMKRLKKDNKRLRQQNKSLKEMQKYANALSEIRVKCNCSHTLYFPAYGPDVQICSHCGHKVYRNDRIKIKEILSKCIKVKEVQNG
jgi:hypothetical protein